MYVCMYVMGIFKLVYVFSDRDRVGAVKLQLTAVTFTCNVTDIFAIDGRGKNIYIYISVKIATVKEMKRRSLQVN